MNWISCLIGSNDKQLIVRYHFNASLRPTIEPFFGDVLNISFILFFRNPNASNINFFVGFAADFLSSTILTNTISSILNVQVIL